MHVERLYGSALTTLWQGTKSIDMIGTTLKFLNASYQRWVAWQDCN